MADKQVSGISNFYDLTASSYDTPVNQRFYQNIAAGLLDRIDPEADIQTILDVGAGTGFSTALLRERYPAADITALEPSPAMTALGRRRAPDVTWRESALAEFEPRPFDLVFSSMSYHWLTALERTTLAGMAAEGLAAISVSVNDRTYGPNGPLDGNKMLRQAVLRHRPRIPWRRRDRHAASLDEELRQNFTEVDISHRSWSEIFPGPAFAETLYARGTLPALFGTEAGEALRTLSEASGRIDFRWYIALVVSRAGCPHS